MLQAGGKADLAEETLGTESRRKLGAQHLERHRPVVTEVVRQVHRGHPTPPELAVEPVVIGESRLQEILMGQGTDSDRGCLHNTTRPWNRHPSRGVST